MDRIILHSDLNNFYASVECLRNPGIRDKPVAVCGDGELRHGIVLAKNYRAKAYGVKTGDVIWEARQKCRDIAIITADFPEYLRFSRLAHKVYEDYTDRIESFGIDECWLDVTGCPKRGKAAADDIRERIKKELGITASVGVSWNKVYAKLASDMKKPDATTVISRENYKDTVFKLPAGDLLYVGNATQGKLNKYGIYTIGGIAQSDPGFLKEKLGKWGEFLWAFASGLDQSPVALNGQKPAVKSVGNSFTAARDLENETDVKMMLTVLGESVAARLREQGLKGRTVTIYVLDSGLSGLEKQSKMPCPTYISEEIIREALSLFKSLFDFRKPVRNIGLKVSDLTAAAAPFQEDMFSDFEKRRRAERLEFAADDIRRRFGHAALKKGIVFLDGSLTGLNPQKDHTIHPYCYFK